MKAGPCKIPRLGQLRISAAGEIPALVHTLLNGRMVDIPEVERRLAYIKQVFDACESPVPYLPDGMSLMMWGDILDNLVEQFGDEHLCPVCRHLLDVPNWQHGETVCLRDGCGYRVKGEGGSSGFDIDSAGD